MQLFYIDDVKGLDIEKSDRFFETHPCFPDRVNTEFSRVLDDHTVEMRVWERGAGETLACGTGACAVAVASILNGYVVKRSAGDHKTALAEIWRFSGISRRILSLYDGPCRKSSRRRN